MRRALLFLENVTAPSETAGAQGYVRPAGRVGETSPREPRRAGSRLLANKGARAGSGEGQGWRPGGVRARQRGAGRGEREKAEYRGVQAQEAGARLAAAVAHARRLAGPGTSFARRVRGDSQGGALAQTKGARRRGLSQLPCGPLGRLLSPGNFGAPRAGGTRGEGLRARRGGGGRAPGREGTGGERGRRVTLPLESSEGGEWTVARQSTIERAPMPSPQGDSQPAATGSLRSHASPCADAPAGDAGHTKGSGACTLPRAGDPGGSREARLGSDAGSVCPRRKHVYKRDVRGLSALDSSPPCWSPPRTTNGSFSNPCASSNFLPCLMKSLYLKYNSIILKLLA